jgi:hypothetical protein
MVWLLTCAVLCRAVLCRAVLCCAVLCCAVLCCAVLCCAVLQEYLDGVTVAKVKKQQVGSVLPAVCQLLAGCSSVVSQCAKQASKTSCSVPSKL